MRPFISLALAAAVLLIPFSITSASPSRDEHCYPFELGEVCLFSTPGASQATATATLTETATATATSTPTTTPTPTSTPDTYEPCKLAEQPALPGSAGNRQETITIIASQYPSIVMTATPVDWVWPSPMTAHTSEYYANRTWGAQILQATARVVWDANSATVPQYVRVVHLDPGPANVTEMGRADNWRDVNGTLTLVDGLIHDCIPITASVQSLLNAGVFKWFGVQAKGNGVNPHIYSTKIIIIYKP